MCSSANPNKILRGRGRKGYKIVAQNIKTGKFYSLAMGFRYENDKDIPIIKIQSRLTEEFRNNILDSPSLFKDFMQGRTSIFKDRQHASYKGREFLICPSYRIVTVSATVSKSVIKGWYNDYPCFLGKRLKIHRIVNEYE